MCKLLKSNFSPVLIFSYKAYKHNNKNTVLHNMPQPQRPSQIARMRCGANASKEIVGVLKSIKDESQNIA